MTTTADIWIGNDTISSMGFEGLIDEVRLWNIARSQGDIAAEDDATDITELTQTANLKGWWRFNAAVGQTDKDLSSVANNATLGSSSTLVDTQDPLRIADQAFSGAKIGFFSSDNSNNYPVSPISLEAYPNPFTGSMNLTASGLLSDNADIAVLDITGTELYKNTISNDQSILLGENLPAGIYLVKITDNATVKTVKIIKK